MAEFGLTMPLKVRINYAIIVDYLSEYFELDGSNLRHTNGQFIEACHAKIKKFFENHPNYNFKDKTSEKYGEAIHAAIVQFNSNNLGLAVYNKSIFCVSSKS